MCRCGTRRESTRRCFDHNIPSNTLDRIRIDCCRALDNLGVVSFRPRKHHVASCRSCCSKFSNNTRRHSHTCSSLVANNRSFCSSWVHKDLATTCHSECCSSSSNIRCHLDTCCPSLFCIPNRLVHINYFSNELDN